MTCTSCLFFNASGSECRRNAPIPVGRRQFAQWPKVKETDWCGQHRKAEAGAKLEPLESALGPNAVAAE